MSTSKTVLVTGTSSGIGLAVAIAASQAGWRVVATLRNPDRADALNAAAEAAGVELDVRALDVTDPDSIAACLDGVVADHGGLDALVNNAGSAHVGTLETDDLATIRACLEVNLFGVIQTSRAALPHLRARRGRLLTVSSVGGLIGQPFNEAYCAAKFAVEGYMQALAPVARTVGVSVGVVEPGAVSSEFVNNLGLDAPALLDGAGPYAPAMKAYLDRSAAMFSSSSAQTPAEVAAVIVDALNAEAMPYRVQTSAGARDFVATSIRDLDGSAVQDAMAAWVST